MKKSTLRARLLTILLTLTFGTVFAVGYSGFRNTRETAREMSNQVLDQASARIDHQIDDLVQSAIRQTELNEHLLRDGLLSPDDFQGLAGYWREVVEVYPTISSVYLTLESDGSTLIVTREPGREDVLVQEVLPGRAAGTMDLLNYQIKDFLAWPSGGTAGITARAAGLAASLAAPVFGPLSVASAGAGWPVSAFLGKSNFDQRHWNDWDERARRSGKPLWTDTYLFFNEKGELAYPGVSYVMPLRVGGELVGVVGIDFNVYVLCEFLKEQVRVPFGGYAFVVEQRRDGTRRLIAHPDRSVLLHEVGPDEDRRSELVSIGDVADPRVPAFLREVSAAVDPRSLTGMRPVRFQAGGETYLGGYRGLDEEGSNAPRWLICTVLPEDKVLADSREHIHNTLAVAVVVLALVVVLSIVTAGQVARPLEDLARDAEAVGRLEISRRAVGHSRIYEVDRLADAAEDMKAGLRSFRKYVPADLVRGLMRTGQEAELGGERKPLTIYFSDIEDFTHIAETMGPERLVEHLGEYLQAMSGEVAAAGGTVDKYVGDAVMAFWGAPEPHPGHALAACTAALRCQQVLARLRDKWRAEGKPAFNARIGINTGEAIIGNIGSAARMNYTAIGDAVNLASRLEGLNKFYGTQILISENTFREAREGVVARPIDWVSVKGKRESVLVYELMGLKGEAAAEAEDFARRHGEALMEYRRRNWAEAARRFEALLRLRPDDRPAREMLTRCQAYEADPPGEGWDGVHHMASK